LYAALASAPEAELVHDVAGEGATILELGVGTGRIARRLVELGHDVTGVDQSAAMLDYARERGIDCVLADIESLDLHREFDLVLLASHLVNDDCRDDYLATCARHGRRVLVERYPADWADTAAPSVTERDGISFELADVTREPPFVSATMRYTKGEECWEHSFSAHVLDDEEVEAALIRAGFSRTRWVDNHRLWLEGAQ
jgi:SAM-dependent methyltransferase